MKTRYNLFLDEHVVAKLKAMASQMDTTVSELIRDAVDTQLKTLDGRKRPESQSPGA